MNTLNGIDIGDLVLSPSLDPKIDVTVDKASDGSIISYEKDRLYENFSLTGGEDWGLVPYSVMMNIKSMASVKKATYLLIYNNISYIVRFRIEDVPVISGDPVNEHLKESSFNNVEFKLMEV